mgnify:CR=1 FL=1
MSQYLYQLDNELLTFPPHHCALEDPNGLLAMGGDLSPQRLVSAYTHGTFPWFSDGDPILWWSPTPRAIIDTANVTINRTLRKFLKKTSYTVHVNRDFARVIDLCSDAPFRSEDTWIVDDMKSAYISLHQQGFAHSVEVYDQDTLIGGLYGVAINGYFSGESMFYLKDNASKIALLCLANLLDLNGIGFIDCQIQNPFLESMGAFEISRDIFLAMQNNAKQTELPINIWQPREITELMINKY